MSNGAVQASSKVAQTCEQNIVVFENTE